MQSVALKELILISESIQASGRPLWLSLIQKALKMNCHAKLYLLLENENDFLDVLNLFVKNIDFIEVFDLDNFVDNLIIENFDPKTVIFIDSINVLLDNFSIEKVAKLFYIVSKKVPIIARFQTDGIKEIDLLKIHSLSQSILNVSSFDQIQLCETSTIKKDGTRSVKLEQYTISSKDLSIVSQAFLRNDHSTKSVGVQDYPSNFLTSLPFDTGLALKESEKRAKQNVHLPYLNAQNEKGLVGINISAGKKIRSGGQIIYTPDKEDDFDESDPDDDLMI